MFILVGLVFLGLAVIEALGGPAGLLWGGLLGLLGLAALGHGVRSLARPGRA